MVNDLIFNEETYYVGRNGTGKQIGIGFTRNIKSIQIEPINSKGNLANCAINIPIVNLPQMIEKLQHIVKIENEAKIIRIKQIINEWGETTSTELRLNASPCISSFGNGKKNHSQLIEGYKLKGVDVAFYNNDNLLNEFFKPYEELSTEILNQVYEILEKYYADCFAGTMED